MSAPDTQGRWTVVGPYATGRESYATERRARRAVDRLDNAYGAYRHAVRRLAPAVQPWARVPMRPVSE